MQIVNPIIDVRFYATELGAEPVRELLKLLSAAERKAVGEDKLSRFSDRLKMHINMHRGEGANQASAFGSLKDP